VAANAILHHSPLKAGLVWAIDGQHAGAGGRGRNAAARCLPHRRLTAIASLLLAWTAL